jgi:hypothetical protein
MCEIWIDAQPTLKREAKKQYQIIAIIIFELPLADWHG